MIKYFQAVDFKGMKIIIKEPISLTCSISKDTLKAFITINYTIKDKQIELVSLRNYLNSFKEETIESLCKKIKDKIGTEIEDVTVKVIGESSLHPVCEAVL